MLHLAQATSEHWTDWALGDLDALLVDHAHLEKKAAGAALRLLFQYPEQAALQVPLARLAREELAHFEAVLVQLARRGVAFAPQRAGRYAGGLHAAVRGREPDRLLDLLLVAGFIEARSCERFGLLARALRGRDDALAGFYDGLLASEARHHGEYLQLARTIAGEAAVDARLAELAEVEAAAIGSGEASARRLHG